MPNRSWPQRSCLLRGRSLADAMGLKGIKLIVLHDVADWKEMLNWGAGLSPAHPLRRRYPHHYAKI